MIIKLDLKVSVSRAKYRRALGSFVINCRYEGCQRRRKTFFFPLFIRSIDRFANTFVDCCDMYAIEKDCHRIVRNETQNCNLMILVFFFLFVKLNLLLEVKSIRHTDSFFLLLVSLNQTEVTDKRQRAALEKLNAKDRSWRWRRWQRCC